MNPFRWGRRFGRYPLRNLLAIGCILALLGWGFFDRVWNHAADHPTSYLALDARVSGQRRRVVPGPREVFVYGFLTRFLPLALLVSFWVADSPRLLVTMNLVLAGTLLHVVFIPRARCQVLKVSRDLDEIRTAFHHLRLLDRFSVALLFIAFVVLFLKPDPTWQMAGILGVRPTTLHPGHLKSEIRTGHVAHHRVRTDHTEMEWVVRITGPITIRIPREDPDFADLVMVLLYEGRDDAGKRYLDQATIGEVFCLSRQMTNVRIALYRRRHRIEDVLVRNRENHVLTQPVVDAIHQQILDDPFVSAPSIRFQLVADGLIGTKDDVALATIYQAMRTVDYLDVRKKLKEMLERGDIAPDHERFAKILLDEMATLAPLAGKKVGQRIVPLQELLKTPEESSRCVSSQRSSTKNETALDLPGIGDSSAPTAARWSFLLYFSHGASYREVARFLGVGGSTVYRRLVRIRKRLPDLQILLGALLFSGVVAVDEKFILIPTARRTEKKMDRWMYLFLAIDPHSYDILHIEVYPDRNTETARAFLLGLKAKGCLTPKVIVSDLWGPYETAIADVYPDARHHQCVFHAEQAVSTMMRKHFGLDFRNIPQVEEIRRNIVHLFRARSRRTLIRRYRRLIGRKDVVLDVCPGLAPVFKSLETHFPKLANACTSRQLSVPKTNNAVYAARGIMNRVNE